MNNQSENENTEKGSPSLSRYISPAAAWALSFGCIVGWGAFVMPGTTFLPIAGPLGTFIGMAVGAVIIAVIAFNYNYMMLRYPGSGGTFTYAEKQFGYDHGFLSAWFMILAYVSIIWANMTAIALVGRNLFGDFFKTGYLYSIAGYDIYIGEILLEAVVLLIFGSVCMYSKKLAVIFQTVFAAALFIGVVISFILALTLTPEGLSSFSPGFSPNSGVLPQIMEITVLAPWAFVGFESVSNSAEEFRFPLKKIKLIMLLAVTAGFLSYSLLVCIAVSAQPDGFGDWTEYIASLGSIEGIAGIPVFYVLESAIGKIGVVLLGISLISAILTGIIGSITASSRLMMTMSEENILPKRFGELSENGIPKNAIKFLIIISIVIPFLGRTAIGWVVDVITVGTTIAYGYTSASAYKSAKAEGDRRMEIMGAAGVAISIIIGLLLLVPNLLSQNQLSAESYLLLAFWGILGIVYFRFIFIHDKERNIGSSSVVWMALLFLIFFSSLMWVRQSTNKYTEDTVSRIGNHYISQMDSENIELDPRTEYEYIESQMEDIRSWLTLSSFIQMAIIMLSLGLIFSIYGTMIKREKKLETEKARAEIQKERAEESSKAKTFFLSNMSHDIRTPMNAIVGYVNLAKKDSVGLDETKEYLRKIESASTHLLALINDILEMSRIESGKMELDTAECSLAELMGDVRDMFATQMSEKQINYTVTLGDIENKYVICDKNRMNRVLLNLISNAYKFTPQGGSVAVSLEQTGSDGEKASYKLGVKDSGIGMTAEFAAKVFEAFERERTSTVSGIQGTGLGMAITKSIIDLMGGTIEVVTAPGKGTEFVVNVSFEICENRESSDMSENGADSAEELDFENMRILLADDVEINREIACTLLEDFGFTVETAENGKEALDKVAASEPGYYNVVLMDIQMPVMGGYDATVAIRALENKELADIPIIAMTANAFSEDVKKAHDAGMNGHIAKPIDISAMINTLTDVLSNKKSDKK